MKYLIIFSWILVLTIGLTIFMPSIICLFKGHDLYDYRVTLRPDYGYWWIATCKRCGDDIYLMPDKYCTDKEPKFFNHHDLDGWQVGESSENVQRKP